MKTVLIDERFVSFSSLKAGDAFEYENRIFVKTEDGAAADLSKLDVIFISKDAQVTRVDVEITVKPWKGDDA